MRGYELRGPFSAGILTSSRVAGFLAAFSLGFSAVCFAGFLAAFVRADFSRWWWVAASVSMPDEAVVDITDWISCDFCDFLFFVITSEYVGRNVFWRFRSFARCFPTREKKHHTKMLTTSCTITQTQKSQKSQKPHIRAIVGQLVVTGVGRAIGRVLDGRRALGLVSLLPVTFLLHLL